MTPLIPTIAPSEAQGQLTPSGTEVAMDREALAIQQFREGKLNHFEMGKVLGLDRFETDALLKRCEVWEFSPTSEDVANDVANIDRMLNSKR